MGNVVPQVGNFFCRSTVERCSNLTEETIRWKRWPKGFAKARPRADGWTSKQRRSVLNTGLKRQSQCSGFAQSKYSAVSESPLVELDHPSKAGHWTGCC